MMSRISRRISGSASCLAHLRQPLEVEAVQQILRERGPSDPDSSAAGDRSAGATAWNSYGTLLQTSSSYEAFMRAPTRQAAEEVRRAEAYRAVASGVCDQAARKAGQRGGQLVVVVEHHRPAGIQRLERDPVVAREACDATGLPSTRSTSDCPMSDC